MKTNIRVDLIPPTYRRAVLTEPLWFNDARIPSGFYTDFASVPRIFWRILPPWDRYTPAAIVHDYRYYTNGLTRKQADAEFYRNARDLSTPLWQAVMLYLGVRIGGWVAWNKYRRDRGKVKG